MTQKSDDLVEIRGGGKIGEEVRMSNSDFRAILADPGSIWVRKEAIEKYGTHLLLKLNGLICDCPKCKAARSK